MPGRQYNLVYNTNAEHWLPTGMSLVSQYVLDHQVFLVVLEVDPWNHLLSAGVHQIFPVDGYHTNIFRIHGTPMT